MNRQVYVYDPTLKDSLSAVRGIGRYLATLRSLFGDQFHFVGDIHTIPRDGIFFNPFYDFLKPPLAMTRIAHRQITVIHDVIPLKYSRRFPAGVRGTINILMNSLALRNYDVIVTDSYVSKQDIQRLLKVPSKHIHVAYPPIAIDVKRKAVPSPQLKKILPAKPFCLYVGDATWNKNLVNLADAIKKANVPLVVAGKVFDRSGKSDTSHPWLQELKEFLRATRGDKRFIIAGYVSESDLEYLYQTAAMNVLVSWDEGFGYSFAESAAYGTPSVLSESPIFHETADDCAVFADPKSPDAIAMAIQSLITDRTKARRLGENARRRSQYFSSDQFKKKILHFVYNGDKV